jgi:parvulin-like peptidyl-prolyl isomerase
MSKPEAPVKKTPKDARVASRPSSVSASLRRSRRYERQTATFEGKRDNRPVLFMFGRHLSAAEKTRLQRRFYMGFAGLMILGVIGVLVFGWVNQNYIQPGQPIVTVNGTQIPQRLYRYAVAYEAQDEWNQLQAAEARQSQLQDDSSKNPANQDKDQAELTTVQSTVSSLQTAFTQTQVDQTVIDNLIEDVLIQKGIRDYQKSDPKGTASLTITSTQVNDAYDAFKKAFPSGQSLNKFLSQNSMTSDNVKEVIKIKLRRQALDKYMQSLVVSPTKQVHYLLLHVDLKGKADADLAAIHKDPNSWNDIVKRDSLDSDTSSNGGDQGWVALGQKDQAVENWAFNAKPGDMSGVIKDINGTFNIVKLIEVDNQRPIDDSTLSTLKSNALSHWLTGQRDLDAKISSTNQDMYNSPYNVPVTPPFVGTQPTATLPIGG